MVDMIRIEDFEGDAPWVPAPAPPARLPDDLIAGVVATPLVLNTDARGSLVVLKDSTAEGDEPIVFVYRVTAEPGSIRAWVFHNRQSDRLAFTEGHFRIVLHDIRPTSPSYGAVNVIEAGQDNPLCLRIPPCVVHGVKNDGARASFVNMPTRAYDPAQPDKQRVRYPDPRIPYDFG